MNLIKNKLQDSEKIINLFSSYLDLILPLLEEKYDEEMHEVKQLLKKYPESRDKILQYFSGKLSNKNIFELYHECQNYYLSLENTYHFFDQPNLHSENIDTSNLSQTYKLETADFFSKLIIQYQNFVKKYKEYDADIINHLSDLAVQNVIADEKHISENLDDIQKMFYSMTNTVILYSVSIQKILDYCVNNQQKILFKIINMVENDKDYFLTNNLHRNKDNRYQNPPLKRFGLIPITDSLNLDDILTLILNREYKSVKFQELKKISTKENICFLILNHVTPHPIEFTIRNLIIPRLAKNYNQPNEFGISEKIIHKFQTIQQKNESKWNFTYDIIGNLDSKFIYILETLDGKTYRCLSFWLAITNDHSYNVPKYKVVPIIEYLDDPQKPSRVTSYHNISINKAIPNMFVRKPLDISSIEEQSKSVDTHTIKTELFMKLSETVKTIIDKEYSKGKKIVGPTQINDILHDERLNEVFTGVLLRMYQVGFHNDTGEFDGGKFPFYEILSSYLLDLRDTTRRFMKDLHDSYNREPLPLEVFSSHDVTTIQNKLDSTLNVSINNQISENDNLYSSLNYKYLILNYN